MATITQVKYKNKVVYKVRLKKKGIPTFTLTFEDLESAANWLDANEEAYFADPEKYIRQRVADFIEMRKEMVRSKNGMIKPSLRKFPNEIL